MNQFDRTGGAQSRCHRSVHSVARSHDEQRAQALAAVQHGITHRVTQTSGRGRIDRMGNPAGQGLLGGGKLPGAPVAQVKQGKFFRSIQNRGSLGLGR